MRNKELIKFYQYRVKLLFKLAVLMGVFTGTALSVRAQGAVPPPMAAYQPMTAAQLDQLLGPIALYPDPLIAQILPASTLPTQIVLADRYVTGGGDPNQIGQQPWDPSVQALARYPSVLKWMDDNLSWTTDLGQAFINQQQDVMTSIQRLRTAASKLGNLQSTPQQQVIADGGDIEIVPADPQVIYVPVYQPDQVYYDAAYGSPFITFGVGWPFGLWMDYDCNWGAGNLIFWGNGYSRPANWWHESSRQRDMGHTSVWRPNNHPGTVGVNHGDRGYGVPYNQPGRATVGRSVSDSAASRQSPGQPARPETPVTRAAAPVSRPAPATRPSMPVAQPSPAPIERSQPVSRPESSGAFIGIQSPSDTRTYSNRGQQSMQAVTRSAPVSPSATPSRSAPAMPSGGGGGGGSHGGGGRR